MCVCDPFAVRYEIEQLESKHLIKVDISEYVVCFLADKLSFSNIGWLQPNIKKLAKIRLRRHSMLGWKTYRKFWNARVGLKVPLAAICSYIYRRLSI